jgi:hypothetical protein
MAAKEHYQAGQDALFEDFLKEQGKDGEQYFCGLCGCLMPISH